MQRSCKHDTAATNRGTIQDGVRYSVGREVIKRKLQTVQFSPLSTAEQFTPAHDKGSRVEKTEVKIGPPGRAVRNAEIEDGVSSLCGVKL
jgi:hypothetical protein